MVCHHYHLHQGLVLLDRSVLKVQLVIGPPVVCMSNSSSPFFSPWLYSP
jgi:hypothetical protein